MDSLGSCNEDLSLPPENHAKPIATLPPELMNMIVNTLDRDNDIYSLVLTCRRSYQQYIKLLYRHNVFHGRISALAWAIDRTKVTIAKKALDAGASVHDRMRYWQQNHSSLLWDPPLVVAVRLWPPCWEHQTPEVLKQHELMVDMLIDRGADHGGLEGGLMLYAAACKRSMRLAEQLFLHDDDNTEKMHHHPSILHEAVLHKDNTDFLELLIEEGFDLNVQHPDVGGTPYQLAEVYGSEEAARILRDNGVDTTPLPP